MYDVYGEHAGRITSNLKRLMVFINRYKEPSDRIAAVTLIIQKVCHTGLLICASYGCPACIYLSRTKKFVVYGFSLMYCWSANLSLDNTVACQ